MHSNPHPSGAKPAGYPKPEPELPSLVESRYMVVKEKIKLVGDKEME
jgi:hypothetical protein